MSLKETIFSMMLEALELGEAVEVRHDRYMRSHGKKARDSGGGSSSWMFTHKPMGDVDVKNKEEVHTAQGKFSDAKKSAQQWGKQHGHSAVYVLESVELDEAIQNMSDARLKFHAIKDIPHGSYTKKEISAEHDRRKKTMGAEYASVKPALNEEVEQIDEISDEKKKEYIRAVADKGGILRKPRPGSLKGFDRKKDDALVKAFKGGSMQDYANLHKKSEKRAGIALNALNSLKKEEVELEESWSKGASSANRSDAIASAKKKAEAAKLSAAANRLGKDHPQHSELMGAHHRAMAKSVKHSYHSGAYPSMKIAKDDHDRHMDQAKRYNSAVTENYELDEAKTDMYHKHILKALGKTRLPKDHNYTSAIANNGDFVVHNAGRVIGLIPKGEHDLK